MDQEVLDALSKQLNQELRNAYLYFAMAVYFDGMGLGGFAHYFKIQAREEIEHALKIYEYLNDRGVKPDLYDVALAKREWNSVVEAIRDFYEAEKTNTQRIWKIVDLARKHGDKATEVFLNWFINEQVEEEKQAYDLLMKIELIRDNIAALITLDRILSERK